MNILDGKSLSAKIKDDLKSSISSQLKTPVLAVVTIGDDEASKVYVNNKKKACEYVGMSFINVYFSEKDKEDKIIKKIKELNKDENINGIIVQLPIPDNFDKDRIINTIDPGKDVDGLTDRSISNMYNNKEGFVPCTPKGIIEIFDFYKIDLEGKNVVIVGRSNLVGKPIFLECLKRNATCTLCHTKTKNLNEITKNADILIVATGCKYLINKDMIKKDAILIDVGITRCDDGKLYGDINPDVDDKCSYKTPVPGGVGPMTVVMLLQNTFIAYKNQNGIKDE